MRIAMLNPPFRFGADPSQWITVPPQGYGGIQWVVATLVDGLLELGHEVLLMGAPGSPERPGLAVSDAVDPEDVAKELRSWAPTAVHDHTDGQFAPAQHFVPTVTTHHANCRPAHTRNQTYLSRAQRDAVGSPGAPIVRLPVNAARCRFESKKKNYLLFLGRVSAHKGPYQAARFAEAAGLPLVVAGPAWEKPYLESLLRTFPSTVEFVGEVGGELRTELLSQARAILVFSQTKGGPFGGDWVEPGATVVSEAAASGTPVISTDNGCLREIVPGVGAVVTESTDLTARQAREVLAHLPTPEAVRSLALRRWDHRRIAGRYVNLYQAAAQGGTWG